MPLNDPSLLTALKAQIQIGSTPQVNTFQATFHYQMAHRVQNHSLDIWKLSRDELVKLLLEKWITNYEQIHQAPVRSTSAPKFVRHENGLVEIKFSSSQSKSDNVFPIGIHMITPTDLEPAQEVKHIWKRKSSQQKLQRRYEKGDPIVRQPSGKFNYYVLYPKAEPSQPPSPHKSSTTITSPPPLKLSPYNQKALSILHQDSPTQDKENEAEMKNLKNQLQDLERQHKQKRITSHIDDPWRLPSTLL
nr:hypothetical protein [Tanacetum cinerariifolium]